MPISIHPSSRQVKGKRRKAVRALPIPVETSAAATLGSASSRWTINRRAGRDESYRPEETGTTLFANASPQRSRIAGMRAGRGKGDLATREEPEASLSRTWKLESGCAAEAKVPYPKYTPSHVKVSSVNQGQSVSRPNQINLSIRSRPRGVLAIVSWFAIESCDQQWAGNF